jgi:hypothetical protein
MDTLLQDFRFAARRLVHEKAFTAVVTLTLALAIAVNTVVFSFLNFFILRPLPVREPDGVVMVWSTHPERSGRSPVPYRDFQEWREAAQSFVDLAATFGKTYNLSGIGEPVRVQGRPASGSLFSLWGLTAFRGRVLGAADDRPGAPRVVLLSHGFWMRRLAGDDNVVGKSLRLDGLPYTVVGVLAPEIEIGNLAEVDVWTPLAAERGTDELDHRDLAVTARLKVGVTLAAASAELRGMAARLARERPATHAGWSVEARPIRHAMAGENTWLMLAVMTVAVSFVLAIACANVPT